jgi:hypothetical protein
MENDQATLNDQVVDTPVVEPTMQETMRSTLDSIKERENTSSDDSTQAIKADRTRAPDGKFAKTDSVDAAIGVTDTNAVKDVASEVAAPIVPVTSVPEVRAPASWTGPAKEEFNKLSPLIQQEVLRREQQMHNGITQYKDAANYAQTIQKTLQPFEANMRQAGVTPDVAIREMFYTDHQLRHGSQAEKLQVIANLARNYGVDMSQGLPQQQQIDPNIQYLQNQLQTTQQQFQQLQQTYTQREESELNSHIQAVSNGKPHFDDLRYEMSVLLQAAVDRGQEITLEQAYEAALWASPVYRQEMITKQLSDKQAEDAAQRAEEAKKAQAAAQAAKAASSINVAKRGTLQAQAQVGSMQDTMKATLEQIRSR